MTFFPNTDPGQIDLLREIANLRREIRMMSQKPEEEDIPKHRRQEITFSFGGPVQSGDSPNYLIKDYEGAITALTMTAGTAGSTSSTLSVKVNGTEVTTVTLASGATLASKEDLLIEVEEWDMLSVAFSAIGSGLASVAVHFQLLTSADSAYH